MQKIGKEMDNISLEAVTQSVFTTLTDLIALLLLLFFSFSKSSFDITHLTEPESRSGLTLIWPKATSTKVKN